MDYRKLIIWGKSCPQILKGTARGGGYIGGYMPCKVADGKRSDTPRRRGCTRSAFSVMVTRPRGLHGQLWVKSGICWLDAQTYNYTHPDVSCAFRLQWVWKKRSSRHYVDGTVWSHRRWSHHIGRYYSYVATHQSDPGTTKKQTWQLLGLAPIGKQTPVTYHNYLSPFLYCLYCLVSQHLAMMSPRSVNILPETFKAKENSYNYEEQGDTIFPEIKLRLSLIHSYVRSSDICLESFQRVRGEYAPIVISSREITSCYAHMGVLLYNRKAWSILRARVKATNITTRSQNYRQLYL